MTIPIGRLNAIYVSIKSIIVSGIVAISFLNYPLFGVRYLLCDEGMLSDAKIIPQNCITIKGDQLNVAKIM